MIKVLVIDDSLLIPKMVKRALDPSDVYHVVGYAADGQKGLELYEELCPDVVLLDITMPVMNGIECAKGIFSIDSNAKIIILSAYGEADPIDMAKSAGVKYFLTKPVDSEKLLNTLNLICKNMFQHKQ